MNHGLNHRLIAPRPAPIGIFDSGVGGLTVLREIYRHCPTSRCCTLAIRHGCPTDRDRPKKFSTLCARF
jgi:glutamate racemase